MAQVTSGKVLRETRERKGYDLTTVARRLRIRPDILRSIESGDFSSMPPRGYTRNMVNAYARLLGLNPTEIVNMYLDEAYAYQVQRARSSAPLSSPSLGREKRIDDKTRSGYGRERYDDYDDYGYEEGYGSSSRASSSGRSTNRRLYDDRTMYAHDDYGVTRSRDSSGRASRSNRDYKSHHASYGDTSRSFYDDSRSPRRSGRQIHVGQTPMDMSAPRLPAWLSGRLPLILGAIAIIVAVVVICWFVFGGSKGDGGDDVSQLPVSGISDTTGTADSDQESEPPVEVAPTSARIVYSVDEGNEVYLETYDNSTEPNAEILQGPEEKTVETTGVWTITTFTPDLVKVTVNGEQVQLKSSDEYNGMYAYTVDFPAILEEWRSTHTSKQGQRQAAVADAVNAASASSDSAASADPDATQGTTGQDGTQGADGATAQGDGTQGASDTNQYAG